MHTHKQRLTPGGVTVNKDMDVIMWPVRSQSHLYKLITSLVLLIKCDPSLHHSSLSIRIDQITYLHPQSPSLFIYYINTFNYSLNRFVMTRRGCKIAQLDLEFPFSLSVPKQVRTGRNAVYIMLKSEHAIWTLLWTGISPCRSPLHISVS